MNIGVQKMNKDILSNIDLIEVLMRNIPREMNLSEIKKQLNLTQHPTYRKLNQLIENKIIKKSDKKYFLNCSNPKIFPILIFIHKMNYAKLMQNKFFYNLKKILMDSDIEIAILFGSYSRGSQTKKSDVDIFIVGSEKIDFSKLELFHLKKFKISPIYSKEEEFVKMLSEKRKIAMDIIKEGIIIEGIEKLYEIMFEVFKNEYGKVQ